MKPLIWIAAGLSLFAATPCGAQQAQSRNMRFQAMDLNGDGVITREEWRGNSRSFQEHDWNRDGVLSGDEVRPGARFDPQWEQGTRFPFSRANKYTIAASGPKTRTMINQTIAYSIPRLCASR